MKGYYKVFNRTQNEADRTQKSSINDPGSQSSLPVPVDPLTLARCSSREARKLIDYEQAAALRALPLGLMHLVTGQILTFAVHDSADRDLQARLKFITNRDVKLIRVNAPSLDSAIFSAYHGDDLLLQEKISSLCSSHTASPAANERAAENILPFRPRNGEAALLLASLVDYAISHNASDIHILPRIDGTYIRLRISGNLRNHDAPICPPSLHVQIINRIKVLSGLDTTIHGLPQDGSFNVPVEQRSIHLRTSIMPTVHGEKAVLRLLGCESFKTIEQLGLDESALGAIESFMQGRQGAIIFAGPTGSGKSTSMYAVTDRLARSNLSCASLEDPVELQLPGVAQTCINTSRGLDYTHGLKSLLRQDPDVILLGEIRDNQSAQLALQAALTGHLLLSSLHARKAAEALLRLRNFGVDELTLAQGLRLIVCQQLVPTLCQSCAVIDLQASNLAGYSVYREVGCAACDYSGTCGRALVCDCLPLTGEIAELLSSGRWQQLFHSGLLGESLICSMQSGLEKLLRAGRISAAHAPLGKTCMI